MIHIICALKCEAAPLLKHFKLEHGSKKGLFSNYINDDNKITLTLSGIGKLNAAAATMHAIKQFEARYNDVWFNIGIAGHGTMDVGSPVLANRIRDAGSGSLWFPQILIDLNIPSCGLITSDTPSSSYGDEMIDMEAAGYYASAGRAGTSELIHCLKIISDNEHSPPDRLRGKHISALIEGNIHAIEEIMDRLRKLSRDLPDSAELPDYYDKFIDNWHFTEYQKIRLRFLLNRWRVMLPGQNPLIECQSDLKKASEVLHYLGYKLDTVPIYYPEHG